MKIRYSFVGLIFLVFISHLSHAAEKDLLIADFEGTTYGPGWMVTGDAFGPGPAAGAFDNQMQNLRGFLGKRLVNSFYRGDKSTGTLTSPEFLIQRDHINMLIGGGRHPGKTCVNLLIKGKPVRTATGPNDRPGGTEAVDWVSWDTRDLRGKKAKIEIVDRVKSGWGHINVDQIVQSNKRLEVRRIEAKRTMPVDAKYLLVPINNSGKEKTVRLRISVDGTLIHHVDVPFAHTPETVDWWGYLSLDGYRGTKMTVEAKNLLETSQALAMLETADRPRNLLPMKNERMRPQLHFSQMQGWNNDPNGMVYYDGEYHLFWQSNPVGLKWGNMYWGHAVSRDMIHWQELPRVLRPHGAEEGKRHPSMTVGKCYSGSANVDVNNTSGWQTGDEKVIVAAFTDTGSGEAMAYSNDSGRTFTYWSKNPIIKHKGRDPKLVWYAPGKHWVIAVYDEFEGKRYIAFYTSKDLKQWTLQSRIEGYYECPELFELPVDGDPNRSRWVLLAADAKYTLGTFDGKKFTPEHQGKHQVHWGPYYAAQCFSNPPDGRVVQIGWARIPMGSDMPFNQTFSLPTNLTLHTTPDGVRMFANPIKEIDSLRGKMSANEEDRILSPGKPITIDVEGRQLLDILVELTPKDASEVKLQLGKTVVTYDAAKATLNGMPLKPIDGKITFRVIVDRPMCELFGNDGAVHQTIARKDGGQPIRTITLHVKGGAATINSLKIFKMNSIWK